MKLQLIVNSYATSVTSRARVVIAKALSADHEVVVTETSRSGHATRLAEAAAQNGVDCVVVLGGDGTLNEAANGLIGTKVALAPLPGGSTNVFARAIGYTNDPIEAVGELLAALSAGNVTDINCGCVNGKHFLFHLGVRFDASVVKWVEERSELKRLASHPVYAYAAIRSWIKTQKSRRPLLVEGVSTKGGVFDSKAGWVVVLNTNPYSYVGSRPFNIAPNVDLSNGLGVVCFNNLGARSLVPVAAIAVIGKRGIVNFPGVSVREDVNELRIGSGDRFGYQVDGDYMGESDELKISLVRGELSVVMPLGHDQ